MPSSSVLSFNALICAQIVLIDAKPAVRKQILRELQIMHDCHSPYIISFYGAFLADPNICICMEYMDKGSLDGIYKKIGAIDIDVVGKVALAVLEGLTYLYDVHRIIHRGMSHNLVHCTCLTLRIQTLNRPTCCSTPRVRLRYVTSVSPENSSTPLRTRSSVHPHI
jgi:serine/threonine protein kinase